MAYDRYDQRDRGYGDEQRSYRSDHRQGRDERGFFDRAREEVSRWFGDEDSGGRRDERDEGDRYDPQGYRRDEARFERQERGGSYGARGSHYDGASDRDIGLFRSDRFDDQHRYDQPRGHQSRGGDRYRPMTGDYGRGSGFGGQEFGQQQYGHQDRFQGQGRQYNYGGWGDRDEQTRFGQRQDSARDYAQSGMMGYGAARGSGGRNPHDDNYSSWRQRQIDELDRDYDEYRREHQARFENEFSTFRSERKSKRQMLGQIREHAEVVDENGEHIGTVDKVCGDTVILTRNDPEAGGVHRSFTCSLLGKVEDGKVFLIGDKTSIRQRLTELREDDRRDASGGFFGSVFDGGERDRGDQQRRQELERRKHTGEGPHALEQSFSGTYEESDTKKTK